MKGKSMKKKEEHRLKLIEHLGNPENEFCNRTMMAKICGIGVPTFYSHFRPVELTEIEAEALGIRRGKYAPELAKIDKALIDRALEGDSRAIKLAYERFEGWQGQSTKVELSGEIRTVLEGVSPELQAMFEKAGYQQHE
jgi:hypothetical protein